MKKTKFVFLFLAFILPFSIVSQAFAVKPIGEEVSKREEVSNKKKKSQGDWLESAEDAIAIQDPLARIREIKKLLSRNNRRKASDSRIDEVNYILLEGVGSLTSVPVEYIRQRGGKSEVELLKSQLETLERETSGSEIGNVTTVYLKSFNKWANEITRERKFFSLGINSAEWDNSHFGSPFGQPWGNQYPYYGNPYHSSPYFGGGLPSHHLSRPYPGPVLPSSSGSSFGSVRH